MKNSSLHHHNGFTLIELMVTTVILIILLSVGVPGLRSLLTKHNIHSVAPFFAKSVQLARTDAIKRGAIVQVRPTSGSSNTDNDWSQGWLIEFANTPTTFQTIRTFEALPGSPTFTSTLLNGAAATNTLVIFPDGYAQTTGTFQMRYDDCVGNNVINYTLFISGVLKKGVAGC